MDGVSVNVFRLRLTLEALETLFEGNKIAFVVEDVSFVLEIDPAELTISRDAIEKSMLALMPTPPLIN